MQKIVFRRDFKLSLKEPFLCTVERLYNRGFDAVCTEGILFFTDDEKGLNPLSALAPQRLLNWAFEGGQLRIDGERLCAGQLGFEFDQPLDIVEYGSQEQVNRALLLDNLRVLRNSLQLFGKASVIKDLLFCDLKAEHVFYGKKERLLDGEALGIEAPNFIGVGEGLTPSFDDFLSGYLMVDRGLSFCVLELEKGFWAAAKSKTTRQSVQQLGFAYDGCLSTRFEEFLKALLSEKLRSSEVLPLINWGHSSGTDILCGILAGLGYNFYGLSALLEILNKN